MKYKKYFKIKYNNNNKLEFDQLYWGSIGLKTVEACNLTNEQLLAAIKSIKRIVKRKNFLIIRTQPFWSLTRKPRDVRMGRGKGTPSLKVFPLKAGKILFELKNVDENLVIKALHSSSLRLPISTIIVKKNDKCTNSIKGGW